MNELWERLVTGASYVELLLIGALIWLWLSHKQLVDDMREELRRRRVERVKESDEPGN